MSWEAVCGGGGGDRAAGDIPRCDPVPRLARTERALRETVAPASSTEQKIHVRKVSHKLSCCVFSSTDARVRARNTLKEGRSSEILRTSISALRGQQ